MAHLSIKASRGFPHDTKYPAVPYPTYHSGGGWCSELGAGAVPRTDCTYLATSSNAIPEIFRLLPRWKRTLGKSNAITGSFISHISIGKFVTMASAPPLTLASVKQRLPRLFEQYTLLSDHQKEAHRMGLGSAGLDGIFPDELDQATGESKGKLARL